MKRLRVGLISHIVWLPIHWCKYLLNRKFAFVTFGGGAGNIYLEGHGILVLRVATSIESRASWYSIISNKLHSGTSLCSVLRHSLLKMIMYSGGVPFFL